jgi:hypothetical protein
MFLKENKMSVYTSAWQESQCYQLEHQDLENDELYIDAVAVFEKYEKEAVKLRNKLYDAEMLVIDLREELEKFGG